MSNIWIKVKPEFAHKAYKFPLSFVSQQNVAVYADNGLVMDRWRIFVLIQDDSRIRFRFWTISDHIMGAGFNPLETLHGGYLSLNAVELSDLISVLQLYQGERDESHHGTFHLIKPNEYEYYCLDDTRLTSGHSFFYRMTTRSVKNKTKVVKISVTEPP
jgi:hypothetical protein